jgi:riboflavin kinase/FMN adenylyltransferase
MGAQLKFIRYPSIGSVSKNSVVTIGNFDGIHKGHQALINQVTNFAKENDLESIVVSMQPLASQYFAGKENVAILTPFKCKYALIKGLLVDTFCVLNFNKALSEISAESFIQNILLDGLMAKHIIVGDDFKFGKNRIGDYDFLKRYCQSKNVSVASIDSILDNSIRVSSSAIRNELSLGNFDRVKSYLGRRFSIAGKISRGQQIGRTLDFPTINIKLAKRVLPLKGIFCVKVKFKNGEIHLGSASLGTRPTVNGKGIILEVHLLDFNKQVYGQNVEVFFYHKIRNEVKFEGLEELKRHIKQDVIKTRLFFNNKTINNT